MEAAMPLAVLLLVVGQQSWLEGYCCVVLVWEEVRETACRLDPCACNNEVKPICACDDAITEFGNGIWTMFESLEQSLSLFFFFFSFILYRQSFFIACYFTFSTFPSPWHPVLDQLL
jgi:hypothetical protein